jgi:hypothetical protein
MDIFYNMILSLILLVLFVTFSTHIGFVVQFVQTKKKKHLTGFLITAFLNMAVMIVLAIVAFKYPKLIQDIDLNFLLFVLSGLMFLGLFALKISIFLRIMKRSRNPENYHLNFFGKKVYSLKIIKKSEYNVFLGSMPFFLVIGAYFIVKLIQFFS